MSRMGALTFSTALLLGLAHAPAMAADKPIAVFVGTAGASSTATGHLTASAKDLRNALATQQEIRLVDTAAEADIVLRIKAREWRESSAGNDSWGSSDSFGSIPIYSRWAWLRVEMQAGVFTDSWNAAGKSWKGSASQVTQQLVEWIGSNRRFLERK